MVMESVCFIARLMDGLTDFVHWHGMRTYLQLFRKKKIIAIFIIIIFLAHDTANMKMDWFYLCLKYISSHTQSKTIEYVPPKIFVC